MPSSKSQLTELQLSVMQALWTRGEATVADVQQLLRAERRLAYTTVATLLKRLETRKLVESRKAGRELVFRPVVSEDEVKQSMVSNLVSRLFHGDSKALMAHLVNASEVGDDDVEALRRLLAEKESHDD